MTRSLDSAQADGLLLNSITFRNKLLNPRFDVAQRGASIAASTGVRYGLDRWVINSVGSTSDMSRQAFTLGQTVVPNNPKFFCRSSVISSAGAANLATFSQRVEGVQCMQGGKGRLTFWAKADGSKPVSVELSQYFGSGGVPSAQVNIAAQKINLTTSWQKFSLRFSVPSVSGKVIGSNVDDYLQLTFWLDAGSNFNARTDSLGQRSIVFDISDVQFESGDIASSLEVRPYSAELAMCQRYYESGTANAAGNATATGQDFGFTLPFKCEKRASPVIAKTATTFTNCADQSTAQNVNSFYGVVRSAASGAYSYSYTWSASAEL